jgi:integrase
MNSGVNGGQHVLHAASFQCSDPVARQAPSVVPVPPAATLRGRNLSHDAPPQPEATPATAKAGISKKIGWHTFQHTYSTLLHSLGAARAVQNDLLRHARIQTTMNVYTQAVTSEKRGAALRVTEALWKM